MSRIITENNTKESRQIWTVLLNEALEYVIPAHVADIWSLTMYTKDMVNELKELPDVSKLHVPDWRIMPVYGKVPNDEFFDRLGRGIFCVNMKLRSMEEIKYLEERDLFHDVFGHVPSLFDEEFSSFLRMLGNAYSSMPEDEPVMKSYIERLYWRTAEFGLIKEGGEIKAIGAGIISSSDELKHCLATPRKRIKDWEISEIITPDYITDGFQDKYFVFEDVNEMKAVLYYILGHASSLLSSDSSENEEKDGE